MNQRRIVTAWALGALVLCGCAGGYVATYRIGLAGAERSSGASEKFGRQEVRIVDELGRGISYFEDGLVKVSWNPSPAAFRFIVENKHDRPIEIVWDDARYVDEAGQPHRVVHSGVLYGDVDKPQKPSAIAPGAELSESIRSRDKMAFEKGIHSHWSEEPLFPAAGKSEEELKDEAGRYVDKTVKVVLPLKSNDRVYEYVFSFEIGDVEVTRAKD